jgi:excisionase family DNA binding protein
VNVEIYNIKRRCKMLTLTEVCKTLHISKTTAFRFIESGKLKAVKVGKIWKVEESELERIRREGTK